MAVDQAPFPVLAAVDLRDPQPLAGHWRRVQEDVTGLVADRVRQAMLKQLRGIALAGDEPVPVAQRTWYREALAEPDPRRALRLYARSVTAVHGRSADVHEVLRAAATSDKDLYKLWRADEDERCGGAAIVVDALLEKCRLKAALDRAAAIDIVWIFTSGDILAACAHRR